MNLSVDFMVKERFVMIKEPEGGWACHVVLCHTSWLSYGIISPVGKILGMCFSNKETAKKCGRDIQ